MTSSRAQRPAPPPGAARAATSYTRFIPREELRDFAAWMPGAFADPGARREAPAHAAAGFAPMHTDASGLRGRPASAAPACATPDIEIAPDADGASSRAREQAEAQQQLQAAVLTARQAGYQDGYRDGLVALDSFKHSYAQQLTAQIGALLQSFDQELGGLEQRIAASVSQVATELARQVVRSELSLRPALVAAVAQEALAALLVTARHVTVLVHPDDHALVVQGCADTLAARGARLISQPAIARGGCLVESDIGTIDARIATRWAVAAQALGTELPWADAGDSPGADA